MVESKPSATINGDDYYFPHTINAEISSLVLKDFPQ